MEWFKVDTNEYLFSSLSMSERGTLITIKALCAHLEKIPTYDQILSLPGIGKSSYESLVKKLRFANKSLTGCLQNVDDCIAKVKHDRESARKRMCKLRVKTHNVTRNNDVTLQENYDIEVDKSNKEEDKKIYIQKKWGNSDPLDENTSMLPVNKCADSFMGNKVKIIIQKAYDNWPPSRRGSKSEYFEIRDRIVKGNEIQRLDDFKKAVDNYLTSREVTEKKIIKSFVKWIDEWDNWVDYDDKEMTPQSEINKMDPNHVPF